MFLIFSCTLIAFITKEEITKRYRVAMCFKQPVKFMYLTLVLCWHKNTAVALPPHSSRVLGSTGYCLCWVLHVLLMWVSFHLDSLQLLQICKLYFNLPWPNSIKRVCLTNRIFCGNIVPVWKKTHIVILSWEEISLDGQDRAHVCSWLHGQKNALWWKVLWSD